MTMDPIAARYAQALFESVKAEGRIEPAQESLQLIRGMLRSEPELRQLLLNPDVEPEDKVRVLHQALQGSWPDVVRAFVLMAVSMGRAEHLSAMAEAFDALVDEDRGVLRAVIRSARPLSEKTLNRFREQLERMERKHVELATELAPELVGGVQIRLDHRVIDGSIRRELSELKERLMTVRV